jgi:hypothetical protein
MKTGDVEDFDLAQVHRYAAAGQWFEGLEDSYQLSLAGQVHLPTDARIESCSRMHKRNVPSLSASPSASRSALTWSVHSRV